MFSAHAVDQLTFLLKSLSDWFCWSFLVTKAARSLQYVTALTLPHDKDFT